MSRLPRLPLLLVLIAVALVGLVLARRTPVPSEDGVGYLWLAQRLADGAFDEAFASPFPPGWPLLLAPWVALGVDPELAATSMGLTTTLAAVYTVARTAERFHPGAGLPAGLLFAANPLLLRLAVEGYSEPLYLWLLAMGFAAGLDGRPVRAGLLAGLAFWVRPEGLLLVPALLPVLRRRCVLVGAVAAVPVLVLALTRQCLGLGFEPLPLLAFHAERDDLPERGAVLANLLVVPGAWLEAFAVAGLLPLAWLRPAVRAGRSPAASAGLLAAALQAMLQVAVVLTFVVRRRFFVSALGPVALLGGAVLAGWSPLARRTCLGLVAGLGLWLCWGGTIPADRAVERDLGIWLRGQCAAGERVVGDTPRVLWFAGSPPPPPRHVDATVLVARSRDPAVRFVVLAVGSRRPAAGEAAAALSSTFAPVDLPASLVTRCADRGLAVLGRR